MGPLTISLITSGLTWYEKDLTRSKCREAFLTMIHQSELSLSNTNLNIYLYD